MAATLRMGAREWVLLIVLSILWGGSFFLAAVAVKEIPPFTLAFLRMGLGALALAGIAKLMGLRAPREPRIWVDLAVLGLIGTAIPFSLIYWGQTEISSGLAAILNAMTPIFTIIVAHFFTQDERFNTRRLTGVLTGFAGVAVIIGPSAILNAGSGNVLAELAVLGATFCYGMASVFGKRFRALPPITIACGQLTFGAIAILPVALAFDSPVALDDAVAHTMPSMAAIAAVLGIALLSTALAYILYFEILRAAGATNAMLVTLLVPVSAILLGSLILGEALEPRHFVGLALIASGLILIDGRLVRWVVGKLRGPDSSDDASGFTSRPVLNDAQK